MEKNEHQWGAYRVLFEPRIRYAWVVTIRGGKTIARCNSERAATQVAQALNIAFAASEAAAHQVA